MRTNLSLTILGVYNTLVAIPMLVFANWASTQLLSDPSNGELLRMGELFHYGLGSAVLIIGLMFSLNRNAAFETAKKLLLAYIIGTFVTMFLFFMVFANEPLLNFSIDKAAPDIIILLVAIFGYLKPKE